MEYDDYEAEAGDTILGDDGEEYRIVEDASDEEPDIIPAGHERIGQLEEIALRSLQEEREAHEEQEAEELEAEVEWFEDQADKIEERLHRELADEELEALLGFYNETGEDPLKTYTQVLAVEDDSETMANSEGRARVFADIMAQTPIEDEEE